MTDYQKIFEGFFNNPKGILLGTNSEFSKKFEEACEKIDQIGAIKILAIVKIIETQAHCPNCLAQELLQTLLKAEFYKKSYEEEVTKNKLYEVVNKANENSKL